MADRKLSSVSAVSDMNFVYAETSTGETVKISKADLASVVAGIMLPFKKIEGIADLNTMGTGFCEISSNMGNIPPVNDSGYIGYVLSFAEKSNLRIQIAMCYVGNSLWFRRTVQGENNYTEWEQFK